MPCMPSFTGPRAIMVAGKQPGDVGTSRTSSTSPCLRAKSSTSLLKQAADKAVDSLPPMLQTHRNASGKAYSG